MVNEGDESAFDAPFLCFSSALCVGPEAALLLTPTTAQQGSGVDTIAADEALQSLRNLRRGEGLVTRSPFEGATNEESEVMGAGVDGKGADEDGGNNGADVD